MAVVTCPKCPTSLRIPDGVSGNVKCPKCNQLFPVMSTSPTAAPKALPPLPPLPPPPKPVIAATIPKPKPKPAKVDDDDDDFEVIEKAQSKKKSLTADDDDPPRSKTKKRNDDDEDEGPRKKKKSRRDQDDEDQYDWEVTKGQKQGHGAARIGLLLLTTSSWFYFVLYALLTLLVFLILVGALNDSEGPVTKGKAPVSSFANKTSSFTEDLIDYSLLLVGLIGLANWIISIIGFCFCIAGPERSKPISIITASVSGLHLILVVLTFSMVSNLVKDFSLLHGSSNATWLCFTTTMPFLDVFIPSLIYGGQKINGEFIVLVLTGICEVIRIFFTLLTIRTLANEGKNHRVAERCQVGIVAAALVVGVGIFAMLLVIVLLREVRFQNFKTAMNIGLGSFFLQCLAYTVLLIVPAITALGARNSLGRRRR